MEPWSHPDGDTRTAVPTPSVEPPRGGHPSDSWLRADTAILRQVRGHVHLVGKLHHHSGHMSRADSPGPGGRIADGPAPAHNCERMSPLPRGDPEAGMIDRWRESGRPSRREFARRVAGGAAVAALGVPPSRALGEGPELIVRNTRPLDAETPVEVFDRFLTPNDLFFVRSHFGPPAVGLGPLALEVGGLVERPLTLAARRPGRRSSRSTLAGGAPVLGQRAGPFTPDGPRRRLGRGAVGNAEWSGVRLADLLGQARASREARAMSTWSGPTARRAQDARLPPQHPARPGARPEHDRRHADERRAVAAPARRAAPPGRAGLGGEPLDQVAAEDRRRQGRGPRLLPCRPAIAMPRNARAAGVDLKPADLVPVTAHERQVADQRGRRPGPILGPGRVEVRGVAWTGEGKVAKVEVSVDDGAWQAAELIGPDRPHAWRLWRFAWDAPEPGRHALRPRHRQPRPRPARGHALEQERIPLERDRPPRLRGAR